MNWQQLLSAKRWGYENRSIGTEDEARSAFQRDYDRLIFSAPFRRLQNKTQVFPLPGSVFVHNRLTHSLEVASVGRSLGRIFYNKVKAADPDTDRHHPFLQEAGNIVSAACLAHDLGNPAFGHSGEAAISRYFTDGEGARFQAALSENQWADVTHFEGNANALRILTHQFAGKEAGGFGLTYSTLASIVKYPCAAIDGHIKQVLHRKKYGFFEPETTTFRKLADELGLIPDPDMPGAYKRHPLVFLVEAADDICYNIMDVEDAHRLGILSYGTTEALLMPLCRDHRLPRRLAEIDDPDSRVSLLRAKAISSLIMACSDVFYHEQQALLSGTFDKPLTGCLPPDLLQAMQHIQTVSVEKIYNAPSVVQIEIAGYKVMSGLLEEFIPAYLANRSDYDKKLVAMIPKQFHTPSESTYDKILAVLDFVSGMTDLYAVELFRKIKGISFPSLD